MDNAIQEKISIFKVDAKSGQMTCYELAFYNKAAIPSVGRKMCLVLHIHSNKASWQGAAAPLHPR